MADISFFAGISEAEREKGAISAFRGLLRELGAKTIFLGKEKWREFSVFRAITTSHTIELRTPDKKLFAAIEKDLAGEFSLVDSFPSMVTARDKMEQLSDIEDAVNREHLVECAKCGRSPAVSENFCPYCGDALPAQLMECVKCEVLYAPAYRFCPECRAELKRTDAVVWDYTDPDDFFHGLPKSQVELGEEES